MRINSIKKIILTVIVTITIFPLTSCSLLGSLIERFGGETDKERGIRRVEEIMRAIENRDREAIISMFSKQVIQDNQDIDKGIDYLFGLVEGEYESYKSNGSSMGRSNARIKIIYQEYRYDFYITTSKNEYYHNFIDRNIDSENPENVGVFSIVMFKSSDDENMDNRIFSESGIYYPTE